MTAVAKAPPEQPGSRADADPGAGAWRTGTVLAGVALAVQLVHIAGRAAHDPLYAAPILDAAANLAWARQIAFGGGLEQEVFLRGPAYLYALAAVLRVAGDTVTPVYVLQGVLAALAVGLAAGLAHRVRGIAAGAVAGLLLACNPALLHFTGEALDTVLAGLLLLAGAALLWWARQRAFLLGWTALAGCVLGLAALTRPSILGLLPLAGLWVAVAAGPRPRTRAVAAGVVLLAAALTIAPATLRNRVLGGDWVPITATSGINLYLGNHAGSDGMSANADALGSGWWQDGFRRAAEVAERDQGRSLRPSEVSRHWRLATWRDARARPLDAARHLLWKAYLLLLDEEIPNNKSLGLTLPHSPIGRLPLPGFALLLAGAVAGLAARRGRGPLPSLLWTVVLGHAAITVLFLVNARYRWPMVPCLAVLAGIGWAELLTLVRDGLRRHSAPGGWLRIALPLAAAVWPAA